MALRLLPGGTYDHCLSTAYPHLRSLHLIRGLRWQELEGFSAPVFQELALHFEKGGEFSTVVSCECIPLHMIQEVSLQTRDAVKDRSYYPSIQVRDGKDRLSSTRQLRRQYRDLPGGTWDEIHKRLDD